LSVATRSVVGGRASTSTRWISWPATFCSIAFRTRCRYSSSYFWGLELGLRQLADEPLGERPLLVTDLGFGALVDLGRAVHLHLVVEEKAAGGGGRLGGYGSRSASSCRVR
jgi:hypothetical protein